MSFELNVLTLAEQFWHRIPGGVAVSTAKTIDALAGDGVDIAGVSAWHRSSTTQDRSIFPQVWKDGTHIEKMKLPRRRLYENWLAGKGPKLGAPANDVFWASSMICLLYTSDAADE